MKVSPDNTYILQLFFAATLIIVVFAIFLVFVLVSQRSRQNSIYMEKQQILRGHQEELLQEQERVLDTVSVQIHDLMGQSLQLARAHLHRILKLATDEGQKNTINEVSEICDQLIRDAKHISYLLNSDYIKAHGLEPLLEQELARLEKHHQIASKLFYRCDEGVLEAEASLIIFRIAQEALHNIVRHSGAHHITVMIEETADNFRMQIVDDGMGFAIERIGPMPGLGLKNMRNRAKLLKGELEIGSLPAKGTAITLTIKNISNLKLQGQ